MYQRESMPYFGGLVSFFRSPGIEVEDVTEGLAVVAGVPIDNGIPQGRVGARFGPRAIREASLAGRGQYETAIDSTRIHVDTGEAIRLKDAGSPLCWAATTTCPTRHSPASQGVWRRGSTASGWDTSTSTATRTSATRPAAWAGGTRTGRW